MPGVRYQGIQQALGSIGAQKAAQQQGRQDFMQKILASVIDQEIKRKYAAPLTKMVGDELYQYDYESNKWKTTGVKKPKEAATAKDILGITAGVTPPETVFPREEIEEVSPLEVGRAEGAQVLTPPGARFRPPGAGERRGEILGPQGKRIGEFLKGYEPRKAPEAFPAVLGQRFGVTKEEAERKYLGLPKKKIEKEKKLTQKERSIIGWIRNAVKGNATIAEITEYIGLEGYDPTDPIFYDEFKDYQPKEQKRFLERFR